MEHRSALDLARKWAGQGWAVFPVAIAPTDTPGVTRKRPACPHGHLDATTNPDQLEQLFDRATLRDGEDLAVGAVPGSAGYVVLDYDTKLGAEGGATLAEHLAHWPAFDLCRYRTASGALNVIVAKPDPSVTVGNLKVWTGVDVRSDRGWIVIPGSTTRHGHWEFDDDSQPPTGAAVVPDGLWSQLLAAQDAANFTTGRRATGAEVARWIADHTTTTAGTILYVEQCVAELARAGPGDRHPTLITTIARIVGLDHVNAIDALRQIRDAWQTVCPDPDRADEPADALAWVLGRHLARTAAEDPPPGDDQDDETTPPGGLYVIDWTTFWDGDIADRTWTLEPLAPQGRQVAIYAGAKTGKSLLVLDAAAAYATGRPIWGQPNPHPEGRPVLYLDYEMTEEDVRSRLEDLGYGPDDNDRLLANFHYALLPNLPPLDTAAGGRALLDAVTHYEATLVVIDTTARAVSGDENDADTYRALYRHTGIDLKRAGVTVVRLDHAGKDGTRGQRGSSAKADDVDLVWRLGVDGDLCTLLCERQRIAWAPARVYMRRRTDPYLAHDWQRDGDTPFTDEQRSCAADLDLLDVPLDASVRTAGAELRKAAMGRRHDTISGALNYRRTRTQ